MHWFGLLLTAMQGPLPTTNEPLLGWTRAVVLATGIATGLATGFGFRPCSGLAISLSLGTSALGLAPALVPALDLDLGQVLAQPPLALEMVQVLATGTTVPRDRIKPSQCWLLYLHLTPSTLLIRDALRYEKSFESVDLQLHLFPRTYSFLPIAPFITSYLLSPEYRILYQVYK